MKATFKINAAGQIPTTKDDKLWETFIANYQKYVCDANFNYLNENSEKLKSAKRSNLKYIGWAGIGGLIGGVPSVLIAQLTGINFIVSIGAALGSVVFLMIKINADTKKRDI